MRVMSRDELLKSTGISVREVPLPELGDDAGVLVRSMTVAERNEFLRRAASAEDRESVGSWLACTLIVDRDGNPITTRDDVAAFDAKNWRVLERIVAVILEVNGMGDAAVEVARGN